MFRFFTFQTTIAARAGAISIIHTSPITATTTNSTISITTAIGTISSRFTSKMLIAVDQALRPRDLGFVYFSTLAILTSRSTAIIFFVGQDGTRVCKTVDFGLVSWRKNS